MNSVPNIIQEPDSNPDIFCAGNAVPAATHLLTFLNKLKIRKIFERITDPRMGKIVYSLESLIQVAMANVLFRMESKNAFHQEGRSSKETEASMAKFAGIDSAKLPATRTIDDVLKRLDHEELNEVLLGVFELLRKDKFFADHSELIPQGKYHLAIDAETVHKYLPNSDHDCSTCPFCLKRQRKDEIWYLHVHVAVSLVCPGGIRIPLYLYPIHAKSLTCDENASADKFKQECELAAFPLILKKIRGRFPRLKFCVLADSLYANGPAMKILKDNRMDFMIVRKEGSMKTVGQDCDGLGKMADQEVSGRMEEVSHDSQRKIQRLFQFFNEVAYRNMKLNILRFDEWVFDKDGTQLGHVHWEWLVSWRITRKNAPQTASRGRMRWLEEDLFNTLKHRGFHIKHDYSRDPSAQLIWFLLILLAFLVTELFVLTRQVIPIKRNRSTRDFMNSIFFELRHLHQKIFGALVLKRRIQFRYCFERAHFPSNC